MPEAYDNRAGAIQPSELATELQENIANLITNQSVLLNGKDAPYLRMSYDVSTGGEVAVTIHKYSSDNKRITDERFTATVWVATTDYGTPAVGDGFAVTTGTTITDPTGDNSSFIIESDSAGDIVVTADDDAGGNVYVMAALDGVVYSTGVIAVAAD